MTRPVTLAQVGIGNWGQNLLRNFQALPNARMKWACDLDEAIRTRIQNSYGHRVATTASVDQILRDPEVDAVVIATLPGTHCGLALRALEAGKHVFVEKPLALNCQDGQKMIACAKRAGRHLMVGHLLMFHPVVRRLKTLIQQGELGQIYYLYSTRVNLGQIRAEENAMWSLTSHDISVALYLLEDAEGYPQTVSARGAQCIQKGIEDVAFVTLSFASGVMAHIHASWLDPHKIRKFTVVGSKRMAVFDDMEPDQKLWLYDKGIDRRQDAETFREIIALRNGDIHIPQVDAAEPLRIECEHFVECVRSGIAPITDGAAGLAVLRILETAQASLESEGLPMAVTPLLARTSPLAPLVEDAQPRRV